MALSDEVKSNVSLRAIAEQTVTWDVTKSIPKRGDYWSPCPFHGEVTASFHVTEPKGTGGQFYCFGCGEKGSVIDYIMARDGLTFTAAVRTLADHGQVERNADPARAAKVRAEAQARQEAAERDEARRSAHNHALALSIWRESVTGHPALAAYLEGRGIRLDQMGGVPPSLRYHPDLICRDARGEVQHKGPAMVAFIGRKKLVGIHRTWIDGPARARMVDGGGKVPKQMLGKTGEIFGSCVRLTANGLKGDAPFLLVGEGIETTLAALAALGRTPAAAEAALSLGALCGPAMPDTRPAGLGRTGKPLPSPHPDLSAPRPGWLPPPGTKHTIILADPSTKCPDTARLHAERALAKITPHCPNGARLAVPCKQWDHDRDFADLAQTGDLYEQ